MLGALPPPYFHARWYPEGHEALVRETLLLMDEWRLMSALGSFRECTEICFQNAIRYPSLAAIMALGSAVDQGRFSMVYV